MWKMEKVYISAPITGHDLEERRAFFNRMTQILVRSGYVPVNPMKNGVNPHAPKVEHMKADFKMLIGCDRILLCEGWENSDGCQKEATVALWSGIHVLPMECLK